MLFRSCENLFGMPMLLISVGTVAIEDGGQAQAERVVRCLDVLIRVRKPTNLPGGYECVWGLIDSSSPPCCRLKYYGFVSPLRACFGSEDFNVLSIDLIRHPSSHILLYANGKSTQNQR